MQEFCILSTGKVAVLSLWQTDQTSECNLSCIFTAEKPALMWMDLDTTHHNNNSNNNLKLS